MWISSSHRCSFSSIRTGFICPQIIGLQTEEAGHRFLQVTFVLGPSPLDRCLLIPPHVSGDEFAGQEALLSAIGFLICFPPVPLLINLGMWVIPLPQKLHLLGLPQFPATAPDGLCPSPGQCSKPVMVSQAQRQAGDFAGCPVSDQDVLPHRNLPNQGFCWHLRPDLLGSAAASGTAAAI